MDIHVNTDNNIQGDERLGEVVTNLVTQAMRPIESRLTRVEVHIKDIRGPKGGEDIEVTIEGRPKGLRPYAVTENGTQIEPTVRAAGKTLRERLQREFGRRSDH